MACSTLVSEIEEEAVSTDDYLVNRLCAGTLVGCDQETQFQIEVSSYRFLSIIIEIRIQDFLSRPNVRSVSPRGENSRKLLGSRIRPRSEFPNAEVLSLRGYLSRYHGITTCLSTDSMSYLAPQSRLLTCIRDFLEELTTTGISAHSRFAVQKQHAVCAGPVRKLTFPPEPVIIICYHF